jgi:hypothetical protein
MKEIHFLAHSPRHHSLLVTSQSNTIQHEAPIFSHKQQFIDYTTSFIIRGFLSSLSTACRLYRMKALFLAFVRCVSSLCTCRPTYTRHTSSLSVHLSVGLSVCPRGLPISPRSLARHRHAVVIKNLLHRQFCIVLFILFDHSPTRRYPIVIKSLSSKLEASYFVSDTHSK